MLPTTEESDTEGYHKDLEKVLKSFFRYIMPNKMCNIMQVNN